jgi:hypothetical protein
MNCNRRFSLLWAASMVAALALVSASSAWATPFTVHWTAPGDDSLVGRATTYDMRYSTLPLTAANFAAATKLTGLPRPAYAGAAESCVVSTLTDNVQYYLAIKTADEVGNWSSISNVFVRPGRSAAVLTPALAYAFSSPWPNPARETVHWAYAAPQAAEVRVDVFDVMGRHVRTIASGLHPAGAADLAWDLHDDQGKAVSGGLYFVKARLGSTEWTKRVSIVR